jgi:hypothetical protein
MSRHTNLLLVLALAVGVAYGWFGVPFFLTILADDTEAVTEELPDQRLSAVEQAEVDDLRSRMLSLKAGMGEHKVSKVLGLLIYATGAYGFVEHGDWRMALLCVPALWRPVGAQIPISAAGQRAP